MVGVGISPEGRVCSIVNILAWKLRWPRVGKGALLCLGLERVGTCICRVLTGEAVILVAAVSSSL